ncbi:MAG: S8 family serine peptidase [Candidatus Cloacimonetes bacterium]|nr:S8 family serine peptidase [Candidatus Cloacimonadota bacterium]
MKAFCLMVIIISFINTFAIPEYAPREMIVKTSVPREIQGRNIGIDELDDFLEDYGVKSVKPILNKETNIYYLVTLEQEPSWERVSLLDIEGIEYIQPNYLNKFHAMPTDPDFISGLQWGLHQVNNFDIDAPEAWDITTGNRQIIVGLVDSGVHFDHPDLQQNIFNNPGEIADDGIDNDGNGYVDDWRGWDFVDAPELSDLALGDYLDQDNDPTDELNHGTHLAGIIGADTNNGIGISGLCWNVRILVLRAGFKTVDGLGYLQDDDASAGIIYAADMGAEVINLSWGDENFSQIVADACEYAYQKGSVIVVSAGNTYGPGLMYPANLSTTISVGSVDYQFKRASFSSYGPQLDLVAPGVNIYSTYDIDDDNLYNNQSGTSMSAPFVTAAIALLFSIESGINPEAVRTRLQSSSREAGLPGFDNEYGHGVLNVQALLNNSDIPLMEITSPWEYQGLNQSFDIIGSVVADNLSKYSVMFTTAELPTSSDWQDVSYPHNNTPHYYFNPVENGVLAHFDLMGISPEFAIYQLKVELMTTDNKHYISRKTVFVDQTEPVFNPASATVNKRYHGEYAKYFLNASFDDQIFLAVDYASGVDNRREVNYTPLADSTQIIHIPVPEPDDNAIYLRAINLCGLESEITPDDFSYELPQEYDYININGFNQQELSNQLVATRKLVDYNNNGKWEFLAQEFSEENNHLKIFEIHGDELQTVHDFQNQLWPIDIGYTATGKLSMLGLQEDISYLYVAVNAGEYPENLIWLESNTYGGNLIDYDNDGLDEIAIIKNETVGNVTRRIIALYKQYGATVIRQYGLINETPTNVKNEFVNKVYCGYLDDDDQMDILASDTDGDIIIYEYNESNPQENKFEMIWQARLPVKNAYYTAIADFTGDGNLDFVVGGYNRDFANPDKTYSYFEFFTAGTENNDFQSIGYVSFDQLETKNAIANADLDGDGDDEVILALPPNSYVVDYFDGKFTPVWKGNAKKTFQNDIIAFPANLNQEAGAIINLESDGVIRSSLISQAEPFNGPATPTWFRAEPVDSSSASMSWQYPNEEDVTFRIYRKQDNTTTLLDSCSDHFYLDPELSPGDTISYQVTAVNYQYQPFESLPSPWKQVVPRPVPELLSIEMINISMLRLKFSEIMSNDTIFNYHYLVNNGFGRPVSGNFLETKTGVLLAFNQPFPEADDYQIEISGLTGETGVPFPQGSYGFTYKEDTASPEIIGAEVVSANRVKILYSEPLQSDTAENLDNYSLIPPSNDNNNGIIDLDYFDVYPDSFYVLLTMQKDLVYSTNRYFLKVENIYDLSDNLISNNGNKCRFSLTDIVDLNHMKIYPNPFYPKESDELKFVRLPLGKEGRIWIYDLTGELVFEQKIEPLTESELNNYYGWDGRNKAGNRVSSGIYLYLIKMGEDFKKGKFAIVN